MRILTNNYQDCKFLNLGSNKNWPYVLRQDGVSPGSSRAQEDRFFQDAAELYIGGRNLLESLLSTTHYLLGKVARSFPQAIETAICKV